MTDRQCKRCDGDGHLPDPDPIYAGWRCCECVAGRELAKRIAPSKKKDRAEESSMAIRARFPIGSKCMRHMGIGVWWVGTVKRITDDAKVVVLFGADANGGIACPFEADEHLIPAPTMPSEAAELLERIEAELQENAELIEAASRPQWPVGYFGPEKR